MWKITQVINLRTGPGVEYPVIGTMSVGLIVPQLST